MLKNVVFSDEASSLMRQRVRVVTKIKSELLTRNIPINNLFTFHYIIHEENRSCKSFKFTHVTETVVSCVNFIKSRGLNHGQFEQFLLGIQSEHENIFPCNIQWLSTDKILKRFYKLRLVVIIFMEIKDKSKVVQPLKDVAWLSDLIFLIDVTNYLNELNTKTLKHENLFNAYFRGGNIHHFPTLATYKNFWGFPFRWTSIQSMQDSFRRGSG